MDLNDWDMAFPSAFVVPDRNEPDETVFASTELDRLRRYRDAVRAGFYNEDSGTCQLSTRVRT